MKDENGTVTATSLADRINEQHDLAFRKAHEALEHARQAGLLLLEAKSRVKHGEWLAWLKANCTFTERTAQRYIKLAQNWDLIVKNDAVSHLTQRDALQVIAAPAMELRKLDGKARREELLKEFISKRKAEPKDLRGVVNRRDRAWRVLRNKEKKQWALQVLPTALSPYTETLYYAVFDDAIDRELLTHDKAWLVDYFLAVPTENIEEIDINGDCRDLKWSNPLFMCGLNIRGWTRFGNEVGPLMNAPSKTERIKL
jgi:hypothetical protein